MRENRGGAIPCRVAAGCCAFFAVLALSACSTASDAMVASLREAVVPAANVDAYPLDPSFRYIRTTHGRHVGFAWLGHTERTPEGPIEVYYSASGEVLRIKSGRVVGAAGFKTEWRRVAVPQLSWAAIAESAVPAALTRVRDVMPGYRFGVRDELLVHVVRAPENSALRGISAESLTWFEERTSLRRGVGVDAADSWLPPARYAVDLGSEGGQVVYSEQCLATDLCLSWQRWSAAMQQPPKPAPQKK